MTDLDAARAAFADTIEWFHRRLDDEIREHTDASAHNRRPPTRAGWSA